ncbi:MAG: FAD-dependent oxidoreductase [Thermodesulfobacteriota bacterium]
MYDVIIVGAGPAGIFTALTLAELGGGRILLLEQGPDIHERQRGADCGILCGWGGAGAYSDGKLTLSPALGGSLADLVPPDALTALLAQADRLYVEHGAPDRLFGDLSPAIEELGDRARLAGLELIPSRIRHIGTENCLTVLGRMRQSVGEWVEVRTGCPVARLVAEAGCIQGVELADGEVLGSRYVVAAPGRAGAAWMKAQAQTLGIPTAAGPVDIGVRVELPAVVLKALTDLSHEVKLVYHSKRFDDRVRTFCMNPYGEVVQEASAGLVTVNGHAFADRRSPNTNFAILVSSAFTEPFREPIVYGQDIAHLANLLGNGVIVQRLADLLAGRRSTRARLSRSLTRPTLASATPGDLSFVFPYRHLANIMEMLEAMDQLAPGVYSRHTLLYGVEVKFYSNRLSLSPELETPVANLFAVGDGAGLTRGLIQASASGILAGRAIARRLAEG